MRTQPSFPNQVWDGKTGSRESINDNIHPTSEDFDRIRDEVIAMQEYSQTQYLEATALENIEKYRCVRETAGGVVLATPDQPIVNGFTLDDANAFDTLRYAPESTLLTLTLPDGQYFLSQNGTISLTPPMTGYVIKVGIASADRFNFRVYDSVRL